MNFYKKVVDLPMCPSCYSRRMQKYDTYRYKGQSKRRWRCRLCGFTTASPLRGRKPIIRRWQEFCCYHVTTRDRLESILKNGLIPNSEPNFFTEKTHYVMLSLYPYWWLYDNPVLIEIKDPRIKREYFDDPEGLRWPYTINPKYFNVVIEFKTKVLAGAIKE